MNENEGKVSEVARAALVPMNFLLEVFMIRRVYKCSEIHDFCI